MFPEQSTCYLTRADILALKPNDRVYIVTNMIDSFADTVLPLLRVPIVLVSGHSVKSVEMDASVKKIVAHPNIIRWHAQNLACRHSKLINSALGIDYHTMSNRHGVHPKIQE